MEKIIVAGIIAEYNPFHNGHANQIETVRAAGATHVVAVMSGNFVQRGGPACAPKQLRANAALAGGVDLVLELPLPYSMATAERFAFGAVEILGALGCVDLLSFGSECGDLEMLKKAVQAVDSPYCHEYIVHLLETGVSYATARRQSVAKLYGEPVAALLDNPNDILAVEYLRHLKRACFPITPLPVLRCGAAHDSSTPEGKIASASYLRQMIELQGIDALSPYLPAAVHKIYQAGVAKGLLPADAQTLYLPVLSALRALPRESFGTFPDLSEGLDNRLYEAVRQATGFDNLMTIIKTKRYPLSRIRRLVWSAYLAIPADMMQLSPPYLRLLAFNKQGMQLLRALKQNARLPLSSSLKRLEELGGDCARFAQLEARATDLYSLAQPVIQPCGGEYTMCISVR